jgi:hypothetical protein
MRLGGNLALALILGGCATITRGTTQTVAIDTPGVAGATCSILTATGPQTVVTPGTIVLAKSSASLPVRCTKACYQEGGAVIASSLEAMTAGNLIAGGVVGIGIDAMSGAANKYPDMVSVPMVPIPGCGAPPPTRRR